MQQSSLVTGDGQPEPDHEELLALRELCAHVEAVFWLAAPEGGVMQYLSPGYEHLWGHSPVVRRRGGEQWLESVHPEDRGRVRAALERASQGGFDVEFRVLRGEQGVHWVRDRGWPVRDGSGVVTRIAGLSEDVTQRRNAEEELQALAVTLRSQANHDALTGLLNRRGMELEMRRELERAARTGDTLVALMLDCDDFKSVNDTLGQALGDVVLREIAERLVDALRTTDRVSRIGGDEFLVGLLGTRMAEAEQVAERIRCSVADRPIVVGGRELSMTVSLGLCHIPPDVVSLEEVVSRVQRTLAISKKMGKNRVVAEREGGPPEEVPSNLGRELIDQVHRGLELRTCVQTVRDLTTGGVIGHEFFVRGPEGPFEQPADLFRLCMEEDYLTMMDLACLRRSVRLARECKIAGDLYVNLFPTTLLDTMPDALVGLLADVGPQRFCFELSEQQLVGDPGFLRDRVSELRQAGVRVALDDVGFGRSSLESLIVLEPDVIKIDRTIVHELDVDRGRRKALQRLVAMAQSLDVDIIAEGVEREPEREALLEAGVNVGQGYLFDRPVLIGT